MKKGPILAHRGMQNPSPGTSNSEGESTAIVLMKNGYRTVGNAGQTSCRTTLSKIDRRDI